MTRRRGDSGARILGQLDEKMEQLALINGVLRTIVGGTSLPDVLRVFASNLKTICPFDRLGIALYDAERRVFHTPFVVMGGRMADAREPARPYGDSPLSKVIETHQPILRGNIREEGAGEKNGVRRSLGCEMLFPLAVGEKPFGVFEVGCFEPGRLNERHLALLADIVPAIAVAATQYLSREKFIFV